ncbi:MAG: histidine phosphatase family protein [Candidatus Liptonbacteria bacterium]|nr:histidine phosphatase family protein [Candidatus Liptonbacteria bacterium]
MANFEAPQFERPEKEPSTPYARLTILRHGEIPRSFQDPNLTEEGVKGVESTANTIKEHLRENEDIYIISSPTRRTRQTAEILAATLEVGEDKERITHLIKPMALRDPQKAKEIFDKIETERDPKRKKLAATYVDPESTQFDNPAVFEPREEIRRRTTLGLQFALRFFGTYHKQMRGGKVPHLISVSHAEVLNPFIKEIFDIDLEKEGGVDYGEDIEITLPNAEEEKEKIPAQISFRGQIRNVMINKKDGTIETPSDLEP